ncbi:hypothetical protein [Candidatus Entotheonella palauensis]|uniref:Uncharacterized protein n=1 Tax=Candidatus Entotheonella gemina TaxID=1429439 RepID=W4M5C4_9BACT|nr:hypothetical protein [Candidatus Entotheonella palauensis]ETX05378.1 MAG: hypothetical protein ETSY2_23315 [Candidatus Entotheonella gemina]
MATNSQTKTVERPSAYTNGKTQRQRNADARQLLHAWLADKSGYDEETWPCLKRGLEANRSGDRKLFRD